MSATTNNQLSATGFSYDTSGNMLNDGAHAYGYNAESEIKSTAGVNYTGVYPERSRRNGDGNRVEKSSGKIYWLALSGAEGYGAGTEILDESDTSGNITNEYVFFGGKRIAMRNVSSGTIYYYEDDMLGSARTKRGLPGRRLVEPGGLVQAGQTSPCYDGDFYPFGGERIITNTCTQNYKFEGKERDTETGNDDFGARYYTSRLGRWLSADWSSVPAPVPYANLTNPQTLNLYAMVSDNPETFADLDGHCGVITPGAPEATTPCDNPPQNTPATTGEGQQPQPQKNGTNTPNSTTQQAQQHNQPGASTVGAAVGAVVGGVVGGVVGAVSGAAGGTLVEPGGGTVVVGIVGGTEGAQTGASIGVLAGAATGAFLAENTKHVKSVLAGLAAHLEEHLGRIGSQPSDHRDQRGWRAEARAALDRMQRVSRRASDNVRQGYRELMQKAQDILGPK